MGLEFESQRGHSKKTLKTSTKLGNKGIALRSSFFLFLQKQIKIHIFAVNCYTIVTRTVPHNMATFKIYISKSQQRDGDNLYPVSIRITWKRQHSYLKTEYYVSDKQVRKIEKKSGAISLEVKDPYVLADLSGRIKTFEKAKQEVLRDRIYNYSASDLKEYFGKLINKTANRIDFLELCRMKRQSLLDAGRKKESENIRTLVNSLEDFTKSKTLDINQIDYLFLTNYEKYLQSERTFTRINQLGKDVKYTSKGVGRTTLHNYMKYIRTIYNEAIKTYNNPKKGERPIEDYPFRDYKIEQPKTDVRNISIEDIRAVMNMPDQPTTKGRVNRANLGRDVFILSFILAGINTVDLYHGVISIKNGVLIYHRHKTENRRDDKAEMRLKLEPEMLPYLEKYKNKTKGSLFVFNQMYATPDTFNTAINKGLKEVARICEIEAPLSSYYARHSWASIARNNCRIDKSVVHEALNHVSDDSMRVTDIYLEKDWSFIWDANRQVLDLLFCS